MAASKLLQLAYLGVTRGFQGLLRSAVAPQIRPEMLRPLAPTRSPWSPRSRLPSRQWHGALHGSEVAENFCRPPAFLGLAFRGSAPGMGPRLLRKIAAKGLRLRPWQKLTADGSRACQSWSRGAQNISQVAASTREFVWDRGISCSSTMALALVAVSRPPSTLAPKPTSDASVPAHGSSGRLSHNLPAGRCLKNPARLSLRSAWGKSLLP